jgi:3-hydroxy-9,10-secoandrosta-1,3,5(10)-triene-9,17-dione monooxygenase
MIADFSERAQEEVWGGDPRALASSSLSSIGRFKRVDGGYLVSGFRRYSSGCDYCAWLVAGADAEVPDHTGRRARRRFLLPIPTLEIVDDWHVLGLAGTGSKSLRGKDVFVPDWRSLTDREFLGNTGPGRALHDHCHLYQAEPLCASRSVVAGDGRGRHRPARGRLLHYPCRPDGCRTHQRRRA